MKQIILLLFVLCSLTLLNAQPPNTCGTIPMTVAPYVSTDYNGADVSCNGASDATVCVNITGGVGPFTIQWMGAGGPNTTCYQNVETGTYTVIVTDLGQEVIPGIYVICNASVSVTEPPLMVLINAGTVNADCGLCNGVQSFFPSGGTPPYNYQIDNSQFQNFNTNLYGLCAGFHSILIRDQNGCTLDTIFPISETSSENLSLSIISPDCFNGNNGEATVNFTCSDPPCSVNWNTNPTQSSNTISNLSSGTYQVSVINNSGCEANLNAGIINPSPMSLNLSITKPTCNSDDGVISINNVLNGTAPFTYYWSTGDSTSTIDTLSAGIYFVQITDANGCSYSQTIILNNSTNLLSSVPNIISPSCNGYSDGSIDIGLLSTGTYTYQWSNGATTEDIFSLSEGVYEVEVTALNGCKNYATYFLSDPDSLRHTVNIVNSSCLSADGSATLNISGGIAPYSVQWDANAGLQTSPTASSLAAGNYFVEITDANNCIISDWVSITDPSPSISIVGTIPSQCGVPDGSIDINVTGGNPSYTYSWSNGTSLQDLSNAESGNYQVTITDQSGCIAASAITLLPTIGQPESVCMVSVDTATYMNQIMWEKTSLIPAAWYKVYRETSVFNVYDMIRQVHADSLSLITDSVANPQIKPWRYKISVVDTCGNETYLSIEHKTIHLLAGPGMGGTYNLIWDDYFGFSYGTFYIWRHHASTGWIKIDSVASNVHSYVDVTAPSGPVLFFVEVKNPGSCDPTRVGVHTSRSNIKTQGAMNPGISELNSNEVNIFPNPANEEIWIKSEINFEEILFYNLNGSMCLAHKMNSQIIKIDVSQIRTGMYFVHLKTKQGIIIKKWIKI